MTRRRTGGVEVYLYTFLTSTADWGERAALPLVPNGQ